MIFFHIRHQITLWEERETPVGTANDESMTWHEMCWASFVYLIKICREGTRPVSFLSKKQWYLFFWSVLINTRYLPSLHILERVQTYKEIIISIISSFSFTPKAQAHSQDHYLAPTDILSIFFFLLSFSLHCWPEDHYVFFLFKILYQKSFCLFRSLILEQCLFKDSEVQVREFLAGLKFENLETNLLVQLVQMINIE